jgi:hypothetical protein
MRFSLMRGHACRASLSVIDLESGPELVPTGADNIDGYDGYIGCGV